MKQKKKKKKYINWVLIDELIFLPNEYYLIGAMVQKNRLYSYD